VPWRSADGASERRPGVSACHPPDVAHDLVLIERERVVERAHTPLRVDQHEVEVVALEFRAPSVAAFVEGRQGAVGPLANLVATLDDAGRTRLRAEVTVALRPFEGPEGLVAPGEALIAVGTK